MPDNASTKAADYATTHGFKILRVGAGMRAQALATLQELEKELASIVESAGPQPTLNSAKYKAMQVDAQATIADAYHLISKAHGKGLDELAGIEWQASNKMVNHAVGVELVSGNIPPKLLEAITKAPIVLGHSSADWWSGQSADLRQKFQGEMAKGTLMGETTPQLLKRLRGAGVFESPVPGAPQGITKKAKRDAEALILTSSATIANHARLESFKAKSDLIKGVQWSSTLDSKTTLICMGLDGKKWRFPDMQPVEHDKAFPGPTAHWRCRSTIISVLYSWSELSGKKLPSIDNATLQERVDQLLEASGMSEEQRTAARVRTRASMDGQVAKGHTYESWANKKGSAFVEQVLGPGRAALYESGKMSFSDLTDQLNRPITLKMLEASVATGAPPPETLGVEFLPPPKPAKFAEQEAEAEKAAKQKLAEEQAKAAALEKATMLAGMKEIFAAEEFFTDQQLAFWQTIPQDEKDVYLADWQAARAAKQLAAKAVIDAHIAAKQKDQKVEEQVLQQLEGNNAWGSAYNDAYEAAEKVKGKGYLAVMKAYNTELEASAKSHLAAFKAGYFSQATSGGMSNPIIKQAYDLAKKEADLKGLSVIGEYKEAAANVTALLKEAHHKKLEKSIIKKMVASLEAPGTGKGNLTDEESKYNNALSPTAQSDLMDDAFNAWQGKQAKQAKQAKAAKAKHQTSTWEPLPDVLAAAQTVPPPASAAVAPKSLSKPDLKVANQDLYFPDPSGLTVIKSLPGSTAPQLVKDPATGKQWVLKQGGGGIEHLKAEATADKLYRAMGASVPGSHFGTSNGKPYKIAEFIDDTTTLAAWKQSASPAEIAALHGEMKKHFVMDALLANWDVAGLNNDNILVKNGRPIRIDNGGSLHYRAQGAQKAAKDWSAKVLDLKGLRDAKKNPNTAAIFKGIKQSDIDDQIVAIVAKKDDLVQIVAEAHGEAQAKILADRIDDLAKQLPATRQAAPKAAATAIGDIEFPPNFEEHAKTRFGTSIFVGSNEFEDQQLAVWNERDPSKNQIIKAQGTLTHDGSKAFVDKLGNLGIDISPTGGSPSMAASSFSDKHPLDMYGGTFISVAKTIATHAKDGNYNPTTMATYEKAKKAIVAAMKDGNSLEDEKEMLAHYHQMIGEIDGAIASKTALKGKLEEYKIKAGPLASPTVGQVVVNGVTISRSATDRITYTVKKMIGGNLQDTGDLNRNERTTLAFKLQRGDTEITVVPYDGKNKEARSFQGIVRINVKGSDPTTAMPEALAVLRDAGIIADVQPTLAQKELMYLHKGFYLRDDHARPEYKKIIKSSGSDESKVTRIKALAETLYGVKLPDGPAGFHRYYNPEGELPKSTAGARFWRRWDEPVKDLKEAEKNSAFYHHSSDLKSAVKGWLINGGHSTSTVGRLRTGVGIAVTGGGSSDRDLGKGGGNFFYTNRIDVGTVGKVREEGLYFSGDGISRIDLASHVGDSYGEWAYQDGAKRRRRIADIGSQTRTGYGHNTGLFKNGISMENLNEVTFESKSEAQELIAELRAEGITKWPDGRALQDVIKVKV